jgi:hypothetical protein
MDLCQAGGVQYLETNDALGSCAALGVLGYMYTLTARSTLGVSQVII